MYGSDYGFVSGEVLTRLLRNIEEYLDADPELHPYKNMFLRENAERLFNRSDADTDRPVAMCRKEPMQTDGIVRLSKVEVYPEYLDDYAAFAKEIGATSLCIEPGVLTKYAVADKEIRVASPFWRTIRIRRPTKNISHRSISKNTSRERCTWSKI